MTDEVKKLKELIDGTDNIVFFGGQVFRPRAVSRIFAVWMACIISSGMTRRRRS